jgi:hypothetical protein
MGKNVLAWMRGRVVAIKNDSHSVGKGKQLSFDGKTVVTKISIAAVA